MNMTRFLAAALGLFLGASVSQAEAPLRERVRLNENWRFQKGDAAESDGVALSYENLRPWLLPARNRFQSGTEVVSAPGALRPEGEPLAELPFARIDFNDQAWRKLDLPHDWGIEGPFKYEYDGATGKLPFWGIAWYRKSFELPLSDQGRRVTLEIDGAMSHAAVWCNGRLVGGWPYGYSSFQLDLTPYVKVGAKNVLAVRLNNPKDSSRWYPGGGIYRNVWLVKTGAVHVAHWGTFITTPSVSDKSATVEARVSVVNESDRAADVVAETQFSFEGKIVARVAAPAVHLAAGASAETLVRAEIAAPQRWDITQPHLYTATTQLRQGATVLDRYETNFGIRTIEFIADRGFLLNGRRVALQGVCLHHDLGSLGIAFNRRAAERQLEIMKEMGVNALRTSHNPPAPELLDLCDRMGILVMDESFDCWQRAKRANDYATLWRDWHQADLRALVRRDRNHPSIILWSIGNEVVELRHPEGPEMTKALSDIVHSEDRTRPTVIGSNNAGASYNGIQRGVDVMGQNYQIGGYARFRLENSSIPLVGSETSSIVSTRGEYFFPVTENKEGGRWDFQVSSYDLYGPGWAHTADKEFQALDENPSVAGEFLWTGFDYLGEPTPYNNDVTNLLNFQAGPGREKMKAELEALGKIRVPSRSSYFGAVDLAGFKKDRFYLYQARWRPDLPMAHLLPHWTWPGREGQLTPVHVYSSGDEAELFLNGQSLGRKKRGPLEYRFRWNEVVYQPGELKVLTYKKGQLWAEDRVCTAGSAAALRVSSDRTVLSADGEDLAFVTVSVHDASGTFVPRAKTPLVFTLSGPGEIIATDNGDATSHVSFQAKQREAFNGLALVVVRTRKGQSGVLKLSISGEGVKAGNLELQVR